jgi:hypothetical protein
MDFANPKSSKLSFGIEANLELRKTQFGIRGHYSKGIADAENPKQTHAD